MSFAILGLGTAVPEATVSREQAVLVARRLCRPSDEQGSWLDDIYAHSAVAVRHTVLGRAVVRDFVDGTCQTGSPFLPKGLPGDRGPTTAERMERYAVDAGPLALRAAQTALRSSGVRPPDITHLVTVSCTGFRAPGVDVELIRGLGLPGGTQRTHIGYMGCHGALNGLRVASALAANDRQARVLLCAVELCSLHYHYRWEPQQVIANALFADGAAALVGGAAQAGSWQASAFGSCLFPASDDAMTWTVGDHGFTMTLSRQVPELIATHLGPWLTDWLAGHGRAVPDIRSWAVHPGGPRILDAVAQVLVLPDDALAASRAVLEAFGNMSSPTVLFILERLRAHGAALPCVALGFGPGLAVEAILFEGPSGQGRGRVHLVS